MRFFRYIHGLRLAHMDIKPENIFISKKRSIRAITSSVDIGNSSKDNDTEDVVYKIGDLGHITSVDGTEELEDEGDCRCLLLLLVIIQSIYFKALIKPLKYFHTLEKKPDNTISLLYLPSDYFRYLPKEILREEYQNLTKADVFALGLTVYEAGGGGPLPKNGRVWHDIRDGKLTALSRYGDTLNDLMKVNLLCSSFYFMFRYLYRGFDILSYYYLLKSWMFSKFQITRLQKLNVFLNEKFVSDV